MLSVGRPFGPNYSNYPPSSQTSGRIVCDPCGIFCIAFVYLILIYSDYAYVRHVLLGYASEIDASSSVDLRSPTEIAVKYVVGLIYQILIAFVFWAHYQASFSDPGVVELPTNRMDFSGEQLQTLLVTSKFQSQESVCNDLNDAEESWTICSKCDTYRPPRAHHCRVCQQCIRKMDHHCPWINNCVGEANQKFFLQFLFYVAVLCLVTILTILLENLSIKSRNQNQIKAVHCIILLIESLLFGIFVIAVFTDQIQVLLTNESTIDRYKNYRKRKRLPVKRRLSFKDLFGTGPRIYWFLPIHSRRSAKINQFVI